MIKSNMCNNLHNADVYKLKANNAHPSPQTHTTEVTDVNILVCISPHLS